MNLPPPLMQKLAQARQLIADHKPGEAARLNAELLAAAPGHPAVLIQASRLAGIQGQARRGREFARRAFVHRPRDPAGLVRLLDRLHVFQCYDELRMLYDEVASMPPEPRLLDEMARVMNQMNLPAQALTLLDRGLAAFPGSPKLLQSRAQTRLFLGDFDGAEADLAALLSRQPGDAFGWWLRAKLPPRGSDHAPAIRDALARVPSGDADSTVFLAYALHAVLDAQGDFDGAAHALDLANRTRRAQLDYRPQDDARLFEALAAAPVRPPVGPDDGRTPVFIIGLHRSGTTLLEQLLSGHPRVRALGELLDVPGQLAQATDYNLKGLMDLELARRAASADLAAFGRGYLDAVAWRLGDEPVFTDKLPANYFSVGFIAQALPAARFLHLVRDPMETGFSNLREYFSDTVNRHAYDQAEMAGHYHAYRALMAHWHRVLPGRILDVDYARLTAGPGAVMREVCAFCGLDFVPGVERTDSGRAVTTASMVQARGGVSRRDQPKWLPYADYLAPLARALRGG